MRLFGSAPAGTPGSQAVVGIMPPPTATQRRQALVAAALAHKQRILAAAALVMAVTCAQALFVMRPGLGVVAHGLVVALLLAAAHYNRLLRGVAVSLCVLPLVLMVGLALPQQTVAGQAAALYIPLAGLAYTYRHLLPRYAPKRRRALGWEDYVLVGFAAIGLGVALGAAAYWLGSSLAAVPDYPLYLLLPAVAAAGWAEELFFRGLLQQQAARIMPPVAALLLPVVAGMGLVLPFGGLAAAAIAGLAGLACGWLYLRWTSVIFTALINSVGKLFFVCLLIVFA